MHLKDVSKSGFCFKRHTQFETIHKYSSNDEFVRRCIADVLLQISVTLMYLRWCYTTVFARIVRSTLCRAQGV